MIFPGQIVEKARTYLGTPWHHTGRKKEVGIDCVGLIVSVFSDLNLYHVDNVNYSMEDEYPSLISFVEKCCIPLENKQALVAGDILVFRGKRLYNHVGFFAPNNSVIHTYASVNAVVEHDIDRFWSKNLQVVYRHMSFFPEKCAPKSESEALWQQ